MLSITEANIEISWTSRTSSSDKEDYRPIPEVLGELRGLEKEAKKIDFDLVKVFVQMGFK
ncbi:MAG: hypothetical protein HWN68_02920 [Desulfobacterales bacterium]|nr:hypothetical protein [Desulfobacterales bacterium]